MCGCLKVFFFFCTYGHARTVTHVRVCKSEGTACVVVVSGTWLAFLFFIFFARTATHVRACESEGTACVVVVSATRFESFLFFFGLHMRSRMYGHACTATHIRARESEGTACVVVVSGTRFESFYFFCTYGHVRTGTYVWARTSYI